MNDKSNPIDLAINNIKLNNFDEFSEYISKLRFLKSDYKSAKKKSDKERYKNDFFYLVKIMVEKFSLQQIDRGINTASIAYDVDEMLSFLEDVFDKVKR